VASLDWVGGGERGGRLEKNLLMKQKRLLLFFAYNRHVYEKDFTELGVGVGVWGAGGCF
jgi:hypothetical protein